MDTEDRTVDELLEKACLEDAQELFQWFRCFEGTDNELRLQAREEVKNALCDKEVQRDPRRNLILRLMSDDPCGYPDATGACRRRVYLAKLFLKLMKKNRDWDDFLDALSDVSVDALLDSVSDINKALLTQWLECFSGSCEEQLQEAKREILETLREGKCDPEKNFALKLLNRGYRQRKDMSGPSTDLAELILHVMKQNAYWEDVLELTRSISEVHNLPSTSLILRVQLSRKNMLQVAQRFQSNRSPLTLHEAVRLGDVKTVENLIEGGKVVETNDDGYTPLHTAAVAIKPNPHIVKLIIEAVKTQNRLDTINLPSDSSSGSNTALHLAAANVNVTPEFVEEFKDADPLMLNGDCETSFHIAAKSSNPDSIVWMLDTFEWNIHGRLNMDDVDDRINLHRQDRLINICARRGNSKAVALLIQHGSDISKGVLHEIVLESVRSPEKVDSLRDVYRTVVDNAVIWRYLKQDRPCPLRSSRRYRTEMRKTVIWLLTDSLNEYRNSDILQCAISHGASAMLREIINTDGVLRQQFGEHHVCFDITNFTAEMMSNHSEERTQKMSSNCCSHFGKLGLHRTGRKQTPKDESVELHNLSNNVHATDKPLNFDEFHTPRVPYVTYLLSCFHRWKNTDVLTQEPLKTLIKPSFAVVKRFYMVVGLLQLMFMILFTVHYIPDVCTLSRMFNVSNSLCSTTNYSQEFIDYTLSNTTTTNVGHSMRHEFFPTWIWLVWPAILAIGTFVGGRYSVKYAKTTLQDIYQNDLDTRIASQFRHTYLARTTCSIVIQAIPVMFFCSSVFAWFHKYRHSDTYESYAEVTSMVLLFGWITNLEFFGSVSSNYSISSLVVKEIILKDIPSYLLFFGFTVVGFSLAIHALRMSTCGLHETVQLHETVYGVLSSAFGMGDFFEVKTSDPSCTGAGTPHLFAAVYFAYIGVTMVVLINVLIAMMNSRYNTAKAKAETVWRFRILSTMRALESHKIVANVMQKYRLPDQWMPRRFGRVWKLLAVYFGCCFRSKHRTELIDYFVLENRYFLRLDRVNDRDVY